MEKKSDWLYLVIVYGWWRLLSEYKSLMKKYPIDTEGSFVTLSTEDAKFFREQEKKNSRARRKLNWSIQYYAWNIAEAIFVVSGWKWFREADSAYGCYSDQ